MRMMVAHTAGIVAIHFAHAQSLDIFAVDASGEMTLKETLKHDFSDYECVFDRIKEHEVKRIVVGAIGLEAIEHLMGRGIDVYYGFAHTPIEEALMKVYQDRVPKGNAMQETFDCHE